LLTDVNRCNLVEVHIAKAQTPLYQYTIETEKKKGDIYNLLGILDGVDSLQPHVKTKCPCYNY